MGRGARDKPAPSPCVSFGHALAVMHDHARSGSGEHKRRGAAHAARSTGDESGFVGKLGHAGAANFQHPHKCAGASDPAWRATTLTPTRCAGLGASRGREMLYDNKPVDFAPQEGV